MMIYDIIWRYDIWSDIFINYSCVDTRWQQYSTHLHTNSTLNNTINNNVWKAFWDSNPEWSNYDERGQTKIIVSTTL